MKKQLLVFSCLWLSFISLLGGLSAQEIRVLDEKGVPLIGVHVRIGDQGTVTDMDGKADIDLEEGQTLRLEYLGYTKAQLTLAELQALAYTCTLQPDTELLEEIIVIGRTDAREIDLPYNVARIKSEEIFSSNAQNTADALSLNSDAFVQKSQLGGGSPVLRGFEANKVLLVVDGVRMNNAIYRNGHLQNAITIDASILQQLEIIYGAGSLLYGSEALGGVIHFRTKSPLLNLADTDGQAHSLNAFLRHNTADNEKTVHLDYSYAAEDFGVLSSISYTDRSDLRMGGQRLEDYPGWGLREGFVSSRRVAGEWRDSVIVNPDPNLQVGTGYSQLDFLQKWLWRPSETIKAEVNIQYSTSSDVPRYDALAEREGTGYTFADWHYGPQQRFLISPKLSITKATSLFDKFTLITSYQDVKESRISRGFGVQNFEVQIEGVRILGLTLDFNKQLTDNQKIVYGIDAHHNNVSSDAGLSADPDADLSTKERILTRYPSAGSQLRNLGAYIQHNWQNTDASLVWINGLRYSHQQTDLLYDRRDPFAWPEYFYEGITSINSAVVGITGLNYKHNNWLAKASTGTAFRSPNVDDLSKIRVRRDEITVPNTELTSEKVWNSELTIGYTTEKVSVGLTGFYTQLQDAIVRENFTLPDGSSFYIINGDSLQVTANINANSGWIRGLSAQLTLKPIMGLTLNTSVSIQKGVSEDNQGSSQPLSHIPPTYGKAVATYERSNYKLTAAWRYNAWKRIDSYGSSTDNADLGAIDADGNEVGTPAWSTLGLSSQVQITDHISLNLALENILDTHYRSFASGVSGAGRHVVVALRYVQ